jgi:hypothetical protein
MPSSISSSESEVLHRVVPQQSWTAIFVLVVLTELVLVSGWEALWRARYFVPDDYEDTASVWQTQRERATGDAVVLIGSSRMWEDIDLTTWQQTTGKRPIQLAIAGRNPRPVLSELAQDPKFHGLVLCEVTPYLFFVESEATTMSFMRRGRTQTRSQRMSNRMGMMLERRLAFIDNETRITTLWRRAPLPTRAGMPAFREVPKGHVMRADRDARMWDRVENDLDYQTLFRRLWLFYAGPQDDDSRMSAAMAYPGLESIVEHVAAQVAADVAMIRARGGDVAFIRFPAIGPVYRSEARGFPRSMSWEPFLAKTHTAGVNFEDHRELQGFSLPEWSHMSAHDAPRFTRALAPLVLHAIAADNYRQSLSERAGGYDD